MDVVREVVVIERRGFEVGDFVNFVLAQFLDGLFNTANFQVEHVNNEAHATGTRGQDRIRIERYGRFGAKISEGQYYCTVINRPGRADRRKESLRLSWRGIYIKSSS